MAALGASVYNAVRARDGKIVDAIGARRYDGPFRCPNPACNARVGLRKGPERAPFFAHLSHQAEPDCYEYSGPQVFVKPLRPKPASGKEIDERAKSDGIRVGFIGDCATTYRIVLELPRPDKASWWEGKILLQARSGEFSIGHSQLTKGVQLKVPPAVRYQFTKERLGRIAADYWQRICDSVDVLDSNGWTYFRDSIGVGFIVPDRAPLSWGTGYWALSHVSRESELSALPGISLTSVEHWETDWYVHRLQLTERSDLLSDLEKEAVSNVLERQLSAPQPRVYLEYPSPHHVRADGAWFVAGPCEQLVLRRTAPCSPDVRAPDGKKVNVAVRTSDERIVIDHPPEGRIDVLIRERVVFTLEVGKAAVFVPPGISVEFGGRVVDLLELQHALEDHIYESSSTNLSFLCPSAEVKALVRFDGEAAGNMEDPIVRTIFSARGCLIDGGPFGWADIRPKDSHQTVNRFEDIDFLRPLAMWLLSAATQTQSPSSERLTNIRWNRCPTWLRPLESRTWIGKLGPQVRYLRHELQVRGLA